MPKTRGKRRVKGPTEEDALKRAEQLADQGTEAFGSPDVQFDLNKDMNDLTTAGIMTPGAQEQVQEELADQVPEPTNEPPQGSQLAKPPVELSDDPEKRFDELHRFLKTFRDNAPSVGTLKEWKNTHGRVFVLNIDDYIFVYRFLKRQEWRQINAQGAMEGLREDEVEDDMFNRCVLWPRFEIEERALLPAGAISMIVGQIQIQSLFLDPALVAQHTIKL